MRRPAWRFWPGFLAVCWSVGHSPPVFAAETIATEITVSVQDQQTRIAVNLSAKTGYRIVTLPDPYRVVIDLNNVAFKLPAETGEKSIGLVKAFRFGRLKENKARIVIDTTGPVSVEKDGLVPNDAGARLNITLANTTERAFGKTYRRRKRREAVRKQDEAAWGTITQPAKPKGSKRVVIIDPGHGGVDAGAISQARAREKDIVLEFAHELRRALEKNKRYRVLMTRRKDVFVPLRHHVRFARKHGADLFISIHADNIAEKAYAGISGATVYTLSDRGSDAVARELARRENKSDVIAGVEIQEQTSAVANILIDLVQRETNARSDVLAQVLLANIRKSTPLSRGPHRSAAFAVLKAPDVPSALIELGYLSNQKDEKRLASSAWRAKVASAIAKAVHGYFVRQGSSAPY
ncbi:MAG: N-acetylmuramoyl-L-alanine amidase [Hyphomicrobiaceae bacterium]